MNKQDLTAQQQLVLGVLRKGYENKVNLNYIAKMTKLSRRTVNYVIVELREYFPVCSTTLDGGGYWIADRNKDILKYIKQVEKSKKTLQLSINYMERHIK